MREREEAKRLREEANRYGEEAARLRRKADELSLEQGRQARNADVWRRLGNEQRELRAQASKLDHLRLETHRRAESVVHEGEQRVQREAKEKAHAERIGRDDESARSRAREQAQREQADRAKRDRAAEHERGRDAREQAEYKAETERRIARLESTRDQRELDMYSDDSDLAGDNAVADHDAEHWGAADASDARLADMPRRSNGAPEPARVPVEIKRSTSMKIVLASCLALGALVALYIRAARSSSELDAGATPAVAPAREDAPEPSPAPSENSRATKDAVAATASEPSASAFKGASTTLFHFDTAEEGSYEWETPVGRIRLFVSSHQEERIKLRAQVPGKKAPEVVAAFACGPAGCSVTAAERIDGLVLVRFEIPPYSSNPGLEKVLLLRWDEEGGFVRSNLWTGTAEQYWSGANVPAWTMPNKWPSR